MRERFDGQVLPTVEDHPTAGVDERHPTPGSWGPVRSILEESRQSLWIQDVSDRWQETGPSTVDGTDTAHDREWDRFLGPDSVRESVALRSGRPYQPWPRPTAIGGPTLALRFDGVGGGRCWVPTAMMAIRDPIGGAEGLEELAEFPEDLQLSVEPAIGDRSGSTHGVGEEVSPLYVSDGSD